MPLSIGIAILLFGVMYILINAGIDRFQAFTIVLVGVAIVLLITFGILMLAIRDEEKFKKIFKEEIQKCIQEIKEFLNINSDRGK